MTRPKIRIRFKYNVDTGKIEEFIIDDNAASASETYHDRVARAVGSNLSRHPEVEDASPLRLRQLGRMPAGRVREEQEEVEAEPEVSGQE